MKLSKSILFTLIYHDIFDYPLSNSEIKNYLIEQKTTSHQLSKELFRLKNLNKIEEKDGFFYLPKRKSIVKTRKLRKKVSKKKLIKANFFAKILKTVPQIKLVAISGALAMENCPKDDDIDFVIITSKNRIWTTRFISNILLFKYKRSPNSRKTKDKACLNIFIDESSLKIKDKNLYTAHEICQMKPIWDRDKTYSRFINSNKWVFDFLPNWKKPKNERSGNLTSIKFSINSNIAEKLFKKLQLSYMKSKITNEKIGDRQLFFHPQNTQKFVLGKYQKNLNKIK